MNRRTVLTGTGALGLGALLSVPAQAAGPDVALVQTCDEHIHNLTTYNTVGGVLDCDDDPLWHAYEHTRDAIYAARPQTMTGVVAKARAAKAEAVQGGFYAEELWDYGPAGRFAAQIVNDLLRLQRDGVL